MSSKNNIYIIVALLIGVFLGLAVGSVFLPDNDQGGSINVEFLEIHPFANKTIQIGYISPGVDSLAFNEPMVKEIIENDINMFAKKLNYGVEFSWMIDHAGEQTAIHLEKVQSFKSMGLTVFQGGTWSSLAQASLNYVNENDMLMVSHGSTTPLLAIADDRLYRTVPTDYVQGPVIAEMWESWGAKAVLIIHRGDAWGDGIFNILEKELQERGIQIIERIRYAAEVSEFSSYLDIMNEKLGEAIENYGAEYVGVQIIAFDELMIITQTPDYPNTREVIWMGVEGSGRSQWIIDYAGGLQTQLRLFSAMITPETSWKWQSLEDRYHEIFSLPASFYTAAEYDAAWIIALSMLEAGSVDATPVDNVFMATAQNFYGASGWVDLDENGDRKPGVYNIWGFTEEGTQIWGTYNAMLVKVEWFDDLLIESGIHRPGT